MVFLASGCATPARTHYSSQFSAAEYFELSEFCSRNGFSYNYDTLDDMIIFESSGRELRILLNSSVAIVNGSPVSLNRVPRYFNGKIYVPQQLADAVSAGQLVSFHPLFAVKTIVIDPGHGGKDPGALSPGGFKEKTLNLIIAKYLSEKLTRLGYQVILTRSDDRYLSLEERTAIAKRHNADLFVSLHANANRSRSVKGVEIYYVAPSRLNSAQRAQGLAKGGDFYGRRLPNEVKAILWDLVINKNYAFSVEMSHLLHFNFKKLGFQIKPPKTAPFYVLRYAYAPSVLVEVGYLTNAVEEKTLRKSYYQKQIAEAIALSIQAFKARYQVAQASKP